MRAAPIVSRARDLIALGLGLNAALEQAATELRAPPSTRLLAGRILVVSAKIKASLDAPAPILRLIK